jgi:hypothetical protein
LRRFFGVLRGMFSHWPEHAEFQPHSEEHLRKWVLCKAGHCETTDIALIYAEDQPSVTLETSAVVEAAIKAAGSFAFVRPDRNGGRIRIFNAKSIAFDKLDQTTFNKLNDDIEAVFAAETGLNPADVLKAMETAA